MARKYRKHPRFDFGTKETFEKNEAVVETTHNFVKRARSLRAHPLDLYLHKDIITYRQWEAGDKMIGDFQQAEYENIPVARWAHIRVDGGTKINLTDRILSARQRLREALVHLHDKISIDLAYAVCCQRKFLKSLEFPHYTNSNQLACKLREVLENLADFYQIPAQSELEKAVSEKNRTRVFRQRKSTTV